EVLFAHPIQRGAVELCRASYVVVDLRLKGLSGSVIPSLRRDIAVVDEDIRSGPVLRLARQPVAPLERHNMFARCGQVSGQRASARARADDDHLVAVHHDSSARRSARMMRDAASISARWEKAWGKFPRCRPVLVSNSSAYRPSGDATLRSFSIRSLARCCSPM